MPMKEEKMTSPRKPTTSKAGEKPNGRKTVPPRVRSAEAGKSDAPVAQTESAVKPEAKPPQPGATPAEPVAPKRPLRVPPLLLEGDEPAAPSASGPGQRYALTSETLPTNRSLKCMSIPNRATGSSMSAAAEPNSWPNSATTPKGTAVGPAFRCRRRH